MRWAIACADRILSSASADFSNTSYKFNSFVHIPLLTSFLTVLALFHDLVVRQFSCWWIWGIFFIIFGVIGIVFDIEQADPHEAAFLIHHKGEYLEFIREAITNNME